MKDYTVADLREMAERARALSAGHERPNAMRQQMRAFADTLDGACDGTVPHDDLVSAIDLFSRAIEADNERLHRMVDAGDRAFAAAQKVDVLAWRDAMVDLLNTSSEDLLLGSMTMMNLGSIAVNLGVAAAYKSLQPKDGQVVH